MSKAQLAFGNTLRRMRLKADVTLGQVARLLAVNVPYLSDVETGRRPPLSGERIEKTGRFIAQKLNADPVDYITNLYKAAAATSGVFELKASSIRSKDVGAQLAHMWPKLTDKDLGEIERVLRREGEERDSDEKK